MIALRPIFLFVWLALVSACALSLIKHNQHIAAKTGEEFAKFALVERNFDEALKYAASANDSNPADRLKSLVESMHPSRKYPTRVIAVSYEPIPGTKSMKIYLEGSGDDRSYHYLAIMAGTEPDGYKVAGIYRSEEPFPGSDLIKPL